MIEVIYDQIVPLKIAPVLQEYFNQGFELIDIRLIDDGEFYAVILKRKSNEPN